MPQIRDLVHTIKSSDLTSAQIESAFGEIFLSKDTIENQLESQEIVDQFRIVKVPTYGQPIPNSSVIVVKAGESGLVKLFTATDNKTYKILAFSITNAGNAATCQIGLQDSSSDFATVFSGTAIATGVTAITDMIGITFDNTVFPAFLITSGDVNDFTFEMAYCEIVQ
jgi:hypothetical protein